MKNRSAALVGRYFTVKCIYGILEIPYILKKNYSLEKTMFYID